MLSSAAQQAHRLAEGKLSAVSCRPTAVPRDRQAPQHRRLVVTRAAHDDAVSRVVAATAAAALALSSSTFVSLPAAAQQGPNPVDTSLLAAQKEYQQQHSNLHLASQAVGAPLLAEQQYEQQVQRLHHRPRSHLPSADESAALQMLLDRDMFTPEAWEGEQ